jgi:hypothetical protein
MRFVFLFLHLVSLAAAAETVDVSTLTGKVMCGYQGWFNVEGDGAERGFVHWTKKRGAMEPGNAKVDLWPDVSELSPEERFPTGFKHADGRVAEIFSSFKQPTVMRHFDWMQRYGIDGAFVQRFANGLGNPKVLRHCDAVLAHCRAGAEQQGRTYAVMYDLSGLKAGKMDSVIADWKILRAGVLGGAEGRYLHHRGKPLVAVWGIGFNDDRAYTIEECRGLVQALKADRCSVMLGVPTGWRTLDRDSTRDPALHEVLKLADVVSPWTVGRYRDPKQAADHGQRVLVPDLAWCSQSGLDYLPVAFPGFSWWNMYGEKFDDIPRLGGAFLWSQFVAAKRAGAAMQYVAMFDEVDEGTAIFKCTNDVPVGEGVRFLGYEGLPPDHYLKLAGEAARMLRNERPVSDSIPFAR